MISGLYIESVRGMAQETAKRLKKVKGVDVHYIEDNFKIIITIEADTVNKSYEIAESLKNIEGVLTVCLAYSNFEEDPIYQ